MRTIQDQPPPVPQSTIGMWDLVIADVSKSQEAARDIVLADMRERDQIGRGRYGTPLQANNGRDALVDLYQEALDATVYARQAVEEKIVGAADLYHEALKFAFMVRYRILARDAAREAA